MPQTLIAANAMQKAMAFLEPALETHQQAIDVPGVIVIGRVKGDIHEIGKDTLPQIEFDTKTPANIIRFPLSAPSPWLPLSTQEVRRSETLWLCWQ